MNRGRLRCQPFHDLDPYWAASGSTLISGKDNPEGLQGVIITGQGHGLISVERIKKGLELVLIWMIGNIAGICESNGQLGPGFVA